MAKNLSMCISADKSTALEMRFGPYIIGAPGSKGDKGDSGPPGSLSDADASTLSTAAANALASQNTLGAISSGSNSDAGSLTGTEVLPISKGGLLQTTTTKVAQWAVQTFKGFTQNGLGAVARALQDELRDRVGVKQFGALGDGTTDDTIASNNAISALGSTGGVVHYSPGAYKINGVTRYGGDRYVDNGFPWSSLKEQARSAFRADVKAANGEGTNAFQALSFNGTPASSTLANFIATATPDVVTHSGWVIRGNQTGSVGSNSVVASNFGAWYENNNNIVWVQEIDVNNEGATQTMGSDNGGVGVAINTGSTYSPDTAMWVRRFSGAGSGPGFMRGIVVEGARSIGVRVSGMSPASFPGMSPAAPGSINAFQAMMSGDAQVRYNVDQNGKTSWGDGTNALDVTLGRSATGILQVGGAIDETATWSAFTPTVTSSSGTFTSATASGRYRKIGKSVFFTVKVAIATNGTAAGAVILTLPANANTTVTHTASGRANSVSGKQLQAMINLNNMTVTNYDNTYPGANGENLIVSGVYEAA